MLADISTTWPPSTISDIPRQISIAIRYGYVGYQSPHIRRAVVTARLLDASVELRQACQPYHIPAGYSIIAAGYWLPFATAFASYAASQRLTVAVITYGCCTLRDRPLAEDAAVDSAAAPAITYAIAHATPFTLPLL